MNDPRISVNPQIMGGKPVIRDTRLTVEYILKLLAHGATATEIAAEYGGVARADIQACRRLTAQPIEQR